MPPCRNSYAAQYFGDSPANSTLELSALRMLVAFPPEAPPDNGSVTIAGHVAMHTDVVDGDHLSCTLSERNSDFGCGGPRVVLVS